MTQIFYNVRQALNTLYVFLEQQINEMLIHGHDLSIVEILN